METPFGLMLDALLKEKGWSLTEFARRVELSHTAVSLVKSGQRAVPLARIVVWADTLGLTGKLRERFTDCAELTHVPPGLRAIISALEKSSGRSLREQLREKRRT